MVAALLGWSATETMSGTAGPTGALSGTTTLI
jgi:hypothetical protein